MDKPELYNLGCVAIMQTTSKELDEIWSLLTWSKEPLPVLEIGCGPGDIAKKVLAPRLPPGTKLVACDINRKMLEFCRQHNALPDTIMYEQLDVVEPDLESSAVWQYAPFGKVFCLLLLHWVPDNRHAVQNIRKLLVPGGETVFTIICTAMIFTAFEEMAKDPRWAQYMKDVEKFISPYQHCEDPVSVFSQLLESEGFQVLHCTRSLELAFIPSKAQSREFMKSVCPFLNRLPEDQKEEFFEDWMQREEKLKDAACISEPKYRDHMDILVAVARKL